MERASLENFCISLSKTAISFNVLLGFQILCLRNIYIFRSPITPAYIRNTINASFLSLLMVWDYNIHDSMPTNDTNIEEIDVCASERSERADFFLHFHIKKLLFLSIFCWYFRNFVGTNYILVGLHVPTDFQMYWQNSEKALLGGGGAPPPPPPSGYASAIKLKLTSTLAPKTQDIYDLMGGNRFCCSVVKYNVLDTKGEGVGGGYPLPRWRFFWKFGY